MGLTYNQIQYLRSLTPKQRARLGIKLIRSKATTDTASTVFLVGKHLTRLINEESEENKRHNVYEAGLNRGLQVAGWQDVPQPEDATVTDKDSAEELFKDRCYVSELSDRDFSPFEHTAHWINEQGDDSLWEEFNDGISKGFDIVWSQRHNEYKGQE